VATELFPMLDPDYIDNPEPYWQQLREKAPLYWSEEFNFWVVTRYEDVDNFAKRPEDFSSSSGPGGGLRADNTSAEDVVGFLPMIQNDPPEHTRLRSIFSKSFTSRRIAQLESEIRELAAQLMADLQSKSSAGKAVDLYKDFASPLPVAVIAKLLGIPLDYYDRLKFWNEALGIGAGESYTEKQRFNATTEMNDTLYEIIEEKRFNPADDLISSLVKLADEDGGQLKPNELLGFSKLLWIAGNETTTNLITNAAVVLQEQPEIIEKLQNDKTLVPQFVEEALRYVGPVNGLFRRVTRDLEYKGKKFKKNDNVWIMFASANRDERHFESPESFILERSPNDHLSLGKGVHFCMGAALARLEAQIAFECLVDVLPGFQLKPEEGLHIPVPVLRGWLKLPMIRKK
jgi:cytochrome P450